GHHRDSTPDAAHPDQSQGCPRDFPRDVCLPPHNLLSPDMLLLQDGSLGNLLCQSEDQCDDMLSDNRPMDFGGVRQHNIAVDQLWKHELVHRCCGSMNPPQVARNPKLPRPEGYRKDDLGIAQMIFNSVV